MAYEGEHEKKLLEIVELAARGLEASGMSIEQRRVAGCLMLITLLVKEEEFARGVAQAKRVDRRMELMLQHMLGVYDQVKGVRRRGEKVSEVEMDDLVGLFDE